ncbi:MAG: mycothiol synthase [Canibacter sp.]
MDLQSCVDEVTVADGVSPFNEATMIAPEKREAFTVEIDDELAGLALGHKLTDGRFEVEFAVRPKYRRQGVGSRLVRQLQEHQPLVFWAHGNTDGAQAFARRYEMHTVRTLYVFELPLLREIPDTRVPEGMTLRTFDAERDADRWVELNARVFADHAEQGQVSREDLDGRMAQPWFNPVDFFVLEDSSGAMVGYNWLKRADGEAEIYVVGVSPDAAGQGLGTLLMNVALGYFKSLNYDSAILYVDDSNEAAVNLYRKLGFREKFVDVQYR